AGQGGSICVVCPPMLGEFTPVSQRGAFIAIYGAIYNLAGIIAPSVMGHVIQSSATPIDGYMTGYTINAAIMIASGLLGLLLLWPNTERARLTAAPGAVAPGFAERKMLSAVPADRGTYTAESIVFARSQTLLRTQRLAAVMDPRFRVAFAGTTPSMRYAISANSSFVAPLAAAGRGARRWRRRRVA